MNLSQQVPNQVPKRMTQFDSSSEVQEELKMKSRSKNRSRSRQARRSNRDRLNGRKSKRNRKKSRSSSRDKESTTKSKRQKSRSKSRDSIKKKAEISGKVAVGKDGSHGSEASMQNFLYPEIEEKIGDQEQPSISDSSQDRQKDRLSIYQQQKSERRDIGALKQRPNFPYWDNLNYRARCCLRCLLHFRLLKFFQVLCAIYICIMTLKGGFINAETGFVVDEESEDRTEEGLILVKGTERAIVGESQFQVVAILIARLSAWFMYPTLILVFLSKLRATGCFLVKSPIAIHMYEDSHELHVYCGWTILYCSGVHGIFHTCRWANQGNLNLLYQHFSGISGLIIMSSCLLICLPMTIFKNRIRYEIRKGLHYFFVLFALALCFHTPRSAIPNGGFSGYVFATILIWYLLDCAYCLFFVTEKIDTTKFSVMPTGVKMTMIVSARFQKAGKHGGVCYVCLPWISKYQWHAFSLFENPRNPMAEREIFIQKSRDWTCQVHDTLQRETVRPAWVQGPFPSPYSNADAYDNQILVASGIGITPALSVIRAHKDTRRINLIWICRDESLLKFILQHLYLDHQGWNLIFYTGKSKLGVTNADVLPNSKVCIIEGRPKLPHLIPKIIFGIESGLGLPERYASAEMLVVSEMIAERMEASHDLDGAGALEDLAVYASELGFTLPTEKMSGEFCMMKDAPLNQSMQTCQETIMSHLDIGFRPWDTHAGAKEYVKNLDKNMVLPTWGMLYCGGTKVVVEELRKISDEYRICLHVESFAW